MGSGIAGIKPVFLILAVLLVLLPTQVNAFGAGNIASISTIEGKNWRHGDIEDTIAALAFIKGHKWTGMMIKRVYFGNWLRDYSQAMDVGTLTKVQADTIRILVWVLAFMGFGYATGEFEVTAERLGVYRPEEHIDNPKDYADNEDARKHDPRLRGPIRDVELQIDYDTGMKNYIANERGDWATSAGYVRYSMARSIHFGRLYTSGGHHKGREEDLCEALRCLGQGLHTLEDFGAHTNYCELALREMGFHNVFPHTGVATQINVRGHHVFPLVTGTFGAVDFFHSVLGEASDHFTQSEMNEMDNTLVNAQSGSGSSGSLNALTGLLGKIPGTKDLIREAEELKRRSEAQQHANQHRGFDDGGASRGVSDPYQSYGQGGDFYDQSRASVAQPAPGAYGHPPMPTAGHQQPAHAPAPSHVPGQASSTGPSGPGLPGMPDFDPQKTISQIYPILVFRDKVVRSISSIIEKIPGLEALVDKISETVTLFIFSLLAPFIRPIIKVASNQLQLGSSGVIDASGKHQYEPWTDPHCTDPTHSLLSKDHFSNILNPPAGRVAASILKFVVPRVLYAWQHVDVPVDQVLNDCVSVFHHPALRNMQNEAHRSMFEVVQSWVNARHDRGAGLNDVLSAESVKAGKNHTGDGGHGHGHGHGHSHGAALGQHTAGYGQAPPAHGYGGHTQGQAHGFVPPPPHQHQHQGHGGGHSGLSNIPGLSNLGSLGSLGGALGGHGHQQQGQHHNTSHSSGAGSLPWDQLGKLPIPGMSNINKLSSFLGGGSGGGKRELDDNEPVGQAGGAQGSYQQPPAEAAGGIPSITQPGYDTGYHLPPPAGYESYHNTDQGAQQHYQPPAHGAHTYDYYSPGPGQGQYGGHQGY